MAKLPIKYHPVARLEADWAFDWYRDRSRRTADRFQRELERGQSAIQNAPDGWAAYLHGTRRYLLKRFPFVMVYRVVAHRIEIIAVAHGHRRPGYWADRMKSP
jgi:toxin ParE1/3/4